MIYDLMEVTPKLNKKKVIIAVIIVIVVISLIICAFFYHKSPKSLLSQTNTSQEQENNVVLEQINPQNQKQKHMAKVNFLPVFSEQTKEKLNNIYHSEEKIAYLTFDDGPSKTVTPLILDLLKQENIKASFFVLGSRVELNPDVLKREYEEGHFLANHGYSHIYSNIYSSAEAVLEEYNKTQQAIAEALGIEYDGHLFRFPGGSNGGKYHSLKAQAKSLLEANQIGYIDWNALSNDSAGAKTKEALLENVKSTVGQKQVVIILMHDAGDKILTYEVLPEVIAYLRQQGYIFKNFYDIMD